MNAILTKVIPATNTKPTRIKAEAGNGAKVIISVHKLDQDGGMGWHQEELHKRAAYALCDTMKWDGLLIGGGTKEGYAFVFTK